MSDAPAIDDHYATEDEDLAASDDRMVIEDTIEDFSPRELGNHRMRFIDDLHAGRDRKRLGISRWRCRASSAGRSRRCRGEDATPTG